jgi:hypothetical protein
MQAYHSIFLEDRDVPVIGTTPIKPSAGVPELCIEHVKDPS